MFLRHAKGLKPSLSLTKQWTAQPDQWVARMEIYQTVWSQQVIEWSVRGDPAAEEK